MSMPSATPNYLSMTQAAEYLKVNRVTIWRLIQKKKLHPTTIAGRRVLSESEVKALKEERG
ncbi:MAG: helix-turn-helix domain-containing protein [Patescibacteria group bacterium]